MSKLPTCDGETRRTILREINRAEKSAAAALATDAETGEVNEETKEELRSIHRLMGDIIRGQLFGKNAMKGAYGDRDE